MTLGGLFSGIGGFELAARWAGITPLWSNEIAPYCCKVLRKNFDHQIIENDIKNIDFQELPKVDILTGGFPCQPFSIAGKRKGEDDDRYLWEEMLRAIRVLKPPYVIGENVTGLLSLEVGSTFDSILTSLEDEGYQIETFVLPACAVEGWHRRDRVWIVAYNYGFRRKQKENEFETSEYREPNEETTIKKLNIQYEYHGSRHIELSKDAESIFCRTNDGVSRELDGNRIKALGNAIVPQVAYELLKVIIKLDQELNK